MKLEMLTEKQKFMMAENEVAKIGATLISIKSIAIDDKLLSVLAINSEKKEYATWIMNLESEGLFSGHYFPYDIITNNTNDGIFAKAVADFKLRQ